jgi:hyperosmotically inducible periplasmic protein
MLRQPFLPARPFGMRYTRFLFTLVSLAMAISAEPAWAQRSDRDLGEKVADTVRNYSRFSIFDDVNIEVEDRNVRLTGRVTAPNKKDEIGKRVEKIDGIRTLRNDIGVLPVSIMDQQLRMVIARAIYGHQAFWRYAELPNPPIHIIVEHQRVTLTGAVDSQVDRMLAYSLAQVGGTLGIENRLRVER